MRAAGLNQKQLADTCGVKPPSVNGWLSEKSKFLRGENLLRAAAALGVSDVWLATGKGEMNARWQTVQPVSPQSETVRLDAGIVATVAEAMRIWLARRAKTVDLTDPEQAELFAEAYAELSAMRATPSDLAAGAVVADLMAVREFGRGQGGSGAAGGVPGTARRGAQVNVRPYVLLWLAWVVVSTAGCLASVAADGWASLPSNLLRFPVLGGLIVAALLAGAAVLDRRMIRKREQARTR